MSGCFDENPRSVAPGDPTVVLKAEVLQIVGEAFIPCDEPHA